MNNCVYGKFIESVRKHTDVKVATNERTALKLTSKPQYMGFHRLDDEIALVQCSKLKIVLDKPIACGFMVLENAKFTMYNMWYNILKPRYGDKITLLLSDTDSFIYSVKTEDGYRDLFNMRNIMDLAEYHPATPLGCFKDTRNKKVPGKFSDELPTEIIEEVISLKPKMYSIATKKLICNTIRTDVTHQCTSSCTVGHSARAKGVSKTAQRKITHEDYKKTLFQGIITTASSRAIRSMNNNMFTVNVTKRALSSYDDKKYVMPDGVNTLSYGHFSLR
eukprot:sb/3468007/